MLQRSPKQSRGSGYHTPTPTHKTQHLSHTVITISPSRYYYHHHHLCQSTPLSSLYFSHVFISSHYHSHLTLITCIVLTKYSSVSSSFFFLTPVQSPYLYYQCYQFAFLLTDSSSLPSSHTTKQSSLSPVATLTITILLRSHHSIIKDFFPFIFLGERGEGGEH